MNDRKKLQKYLHDKLRDCVALTAENC